jgi:hypothetical protein
MQPENLVLAANHRLVEDIAASFKQQLPAVDVTASCVAVAVTNDTVSGLSTGVRITVPLYPSLSLSSLSLSVPLSLSPALSPALPLSHSHPLSPPLHTHSLPLSHSRCKFHPPSQR